MAAADAAKDVAKKSGGAIKWTFNQLNPLPGGKLGRTLMLMGTTALAGTALASGLPAAGTLAANFGAAAWNGLTTIGQVGVDVAVNTDWNAILEGVSATGETIASSVNTAPA